MKHNLIAGLLYVALLVPSAATWAEEHGMYIEGLIGATRAPSVDEVALSLRSDTDIALGLVIGNRFSESISYEAEVVYAKAKWDAGDDIGITADGFGVGLNILNAIGGPPAQFEIGVGLGWMFFEEACIEGDGLRFCADASEDDWSIQGILGASFDVSQRGEIVARYRMKNIGGFSSDDRLHVFTAGYRYNF